MKSSAASPASLTNNGFFYGRVGYADKNLTSNLHYYAFDNIANALWFDAKYAIKGKIKPFVAVQIGDEKSTGSALVGQIDSQVYGIQGGVSVSPNVVVTLGYNHIPDKTATITLPAGASCPANHVLAADKGLADYFLGNGGTPNCIPGPAVNGLNTATVYYGGWASPYTDSYATDPLFTTSISQGMADRRSFGDAGKLAATFTSDNKRFVFILSRALVLVRQQCRRCIAHARNEFRRHVLLQPSAEVGFVQGPPRPLPVRGTYHQLHDGLWWYPALQVQPRASGIRLLVVKRT